MAKSFIKFYVIQYQKKNAFYVELFLYVYSILQTELYFPGGLVKNHSQISTLGCLESIANKTACT